MDFRLSAEEEKLRKEVREFLKSEKELIHKIRMEEASGVGIGPTMWEFLRKIGAKGWLTPSWPKEYGGLGLSHMSRHILAEEFSYHVARMATVGAAMAGPTILRFGSEEQKKEFLPRIARGEIEFALGYSEPESGSDLASLQMRAVKDGDNYIISGQKVFNTACHFADYHWLAARTDPTAKKHHGISLIIVDMKAPGITLRPLIGMGKIRTNEVFYDEVKVPRSRLVGEENQGWSYLAAALAFERTWHAGENEYDLEQLVQYIKNNKRNGKPLADDAALRREVAHSAVEVELARLFAFRIACMLDKGTIPTYETSMTKLWGSESSYRLSDLWMKVLGSSAQLDIDTKHAVQDGRVARLYYNRATRSLITAGTSEIMRNVIALMLGLPRG